MARKFKPVRFKVTEKGCWEVYTHKPIGSGGRWKYIILNREGKMIRLHREMYKLFNKPIPEGLFVCHTCDNTICINPDHLFVGTAADNNKDCRDKGRFRPHHLPLKLIKEHVIVIRNSDSSIKDLAVFYCVSKQMIYDIQQGKYWKHIGGKIRKGVGAGWHGDPDGHRISASFRKH